jgi:Helix-turn-helix domain
VEKVTTQMATDGRNANMAALACGVELLTQEEAAALLHKSPRVLRFWRTAGIGPAYVKLGKTVLYNRDDLITYVRSNTVQPSVRAAFEEENCGAL